jgi:hypothetical protein
MSWFIDILARVIPRMSFENGFAGRTNAGTVGAGVRSLGFAAAGTLAVVGSALAAVPAPRVNATSKPPATSEQATLLTPQAPTVALEVVPDRDAVELKEKVSLVVIVTNKSSISLTGLNVSVQSAAFRFAAAPGSLANVSAFGTAYGTITLEPIRREDVKNGTPDAAFGSHKLAVIVEYFWSGPTGAGRSAQTATVVLQVKRRFEEEAKGLPGGTAAFLYLFLPIVPAFLAFDVVDRLRKGEALRIPTFGTEQIVPAFMLSLLLSIGFTTAASLNIELAYSSPTLFLGVLGLSAILGAAVPGGLLFRDTWIRWRWAFKKDDSLAEYLRKALLKPNRQSSYVWVEGTVGAETWQGVKLQQPDGAVVLGAQLQASPAKADENARKGVWTTLTTSVFDKSGAVKNCPLLVNLVRTGEVSLDFNQTIKRDGPEIRDVVATDGFKEFKETKATPTPLVLPVS